jgi:hypothetical protein
LPGATGSRASALNDGGQVVGTSVNRLHLGSSDAVLWTVRAAEPGAPTVDRLNAVVLPPGLLTAPDGTPLSGVWLRVRLADPGDAGPWDWRIDWGDGVVHTPTDVRRTGEFAFLRSAPYTTAGPHTITVTATDPSGLTSTPATTVAP